MHCFASEIQTYTRTWLFGVESWKSLKGPENLLLKNLQVKTRVEKVWFLSENIFSWKCGIQSTNEMAFKRTVTLRASFRFPAIRFDAPTLLSFSGFTHAHAKCPPVIVFAFFAQRRVRNASYWWWSGRDDGNKPRLPFATIFIERETSRNKAEIIRFGNPCWYLLSLRELRKRFRSFFSAFAKQTASYTGYNPFPYKKDKNQPKFWSVVSDVFEPQVLESNLIFSNFPITESSTSLQTDEVVFVPHRTMQITHF